MDMLRAIVSCLTGSEYPPDYDAKLRISNSEDEQERLAADIVDILFTADKPPKILKHQLNNDVHTTGWYEELAKHISTLR